MAKRSLTPEQDMVFGQIERAMLPAFEDAWTKLTAAGFEADEDEVRWTRHNLHPFTRRCSMSAFAELDPTVPVVASLSRIPIKRSSPRPLAGRSTG
jgi:hypothetical protein